jgi:hypothetical protein
MSDENAEVGGPFVASPEGLTNSEIGTSNLNNWIKDYSENVGSDLTREQEEKRKGAEGKLLGFMLENVTRADHTEIVGATNKIDQTDNEEDKTKQKESIAKKFEGDNLSLDEAYTLGTVFREFGDKAYDVFGEKKSEKPATGSDKLYEGYPIEYWYKVKTDNLVKEKLSEEEKGLDDKADEYIFQRALAQAPLEKLKEYEEVVSKKEKAKTEEEERSWQTIAAASAGALLYDLVQELGPAAEITVASILEKKFTRSFRKVKKNIDIEDANNRQEKKDLSLDDKVKNAVYKELDKAETDEQKKISEKIRNEAGTNPDVSLFKLIKEQLNILKKNPDDKTRMWLRRSQRIVLEQTRDSNTNTSLWSELRRQISNLQHSLGQQSYEDVHAKLQGMDTEINSAKDNYKLKHAWSRHLDGVLEDYRDSAVDQMDRAYVNAKLRDLQREGRGDSDEAKLLEEEIGRLNNDIDYRAWETTTPTDLEAIAENYVKYENEKKRKESGEDISSMTYLQAKGLVLSLGLEPDLAPEEEARKDGAEERMKNLVDEMDKQNKLDDIKTKVQTDHATLQALFLKANSNTLTQQELDTFKNRLAREMREASRYTELEGEGTMRGVREDYFMKFLRIYESNANRLSTPDTAPTQTVDTQAITAATIGQEIGKALAEKLGGNRLTQDDFLRNEKWGEYPYSFSIDNPPTFYQEMKYNDKEEFLGRVRLHHASYLKRKGDAGFTLEGISKNSILKEITNEQMDRVWDIPGVTFALSEYLQAIEDPKNNSSLIITKDVVENGRTETKRFNLHKVDSLEESNDYRSHMVERVKNEISPNIRRLIKADLKSQYLSDGVSVAEAERRAEEEIEDKIKKSAEVAEQVAFNLHFSANTAETRASGWEIKDNQPTVRTQEPDLASSWFVQAPLRGQMMPLEALVGQLFKDRKDRTIIGSLSEWASQQAQESARKSGYKKDKSVISKVEIISNENSRINMSQSFKLSKEHGKDDKGKQNFSIKVPECYPVQVFGSYWEEVQKKDGGVYIRGTGQKMNVLDAIRQKKKIDWSRTGYTWNDYTFDAGKESIILNSIQGDFQPHADLIKALARRKKRDNDRLIRWMMYANYGVDPKSRLPRITVKDMAKRSIVDVLAINQDVEGGLIERSQMFFPWDDIRYRKRMN